MGSLLFEPEKPSARRLMALRPGKSPRRTPRVARVSRSRPRLRSGVVVAWLALLMSAPFLARGIEMSKVDAAAGRATARVAVAAPDDVRTPETGGLIVDEAVMLIGAGDGVRPNIAGFRFRGLQVPQGAIVEAVQFSLVKVGSDWNALRLDLAFEASDDAAPFGEGAPLDSRVCTNAIVALNEPLRLADGGRDTLGDPARLAASLQEVVGRPGWRAGNSAMLIAYGPATPAWARLTFASADAGPERAPQLMVTYRMPGGR